MCIGTSKAVIFNVYSCELRCVLFCNRFLVGQYVTIHDDVISHVNISNLKEEDGGEYTCTARNSVAQVSHNARINVYGKKVSYKCKQCHFNIALFWFRGTLFSHSFTYMSVFRYWLIICKYVLDIYQSQVWFIEISIQYHLIWNS